MVDNIHMFFSTNGLQNYLHDKLHDLNARFQIIITGIGHPFADFIWPNNTYLLRQKADMPMPKHRRQGTTWQVLSVK